MVSGDMFDPVVDHFAERHRVIVPDLRGHGRSRDLPPPYDAAQLAADLAVLLDHLGITSAAVLGYSQGGAIAQQLALDHPTRCGRLVLGCTYAYNMATPREKVEGILGSILLRFISIRRLAKFGLAQGAAQTTRQQADWLVGIMASQDQEKMRLAWHEMMAFDSRRRLGEITCPTLVLAAANDQAVPMHHAKMLHDGIRGSQLVVIDGADHTLIWTRTDEFLRAVDGFM